MADAAGLYVYALIRTHSAGPAPGSGIDGAALLPVTVGGITAIVHAHHGPPYSGSDETVRRRVLEHNEVVDRLWERDHAVLPMTFDVIVAGTADESAEERLGAWLRDVAEPARRALDHVDGRVELRVDLTLDQQDGAAGDPEVQALRERIADAQPGIARLLRKRLDGLERDATEALADRRHPEARARLARCSVDLVENPRASAGPGEILLLSAALLVDEDAVDRVGRELAAMQAEEPALRVLYLGPWPPYSFAALRPGPAGTATSAAA